MVNNTNFEATRWLLISKPPGQRFMVLASPVPNEREKRFFEQILLHGGRLTLEAPAASTNSPSKVFSFRLNGPVEHLRCLNMQMNGQFGNLVSVFMKWN